MVDEAEQPTSEQLLAVIATQTEIARLGLDLNGVMSLVAQRAMEISRSAGSVVEVVDGDEMVYRAVAGTAVPFLGVRLDRATSLSGLSVARNAVLYAEDTEVDERVDREACRRVGSRSMIVVPLVHQGGAAGVLKVYSPIPRAFDNRDIRVLTLMSDLIAAAMFHAATYGADELFRQATTDSLTGLANRAMFMDRLRSGIAASVRETRTLGVLIIDMDGLKPINDVHGHRAGDAAIREVAARLARTARGTDTVARIGGDEFALVLPGIQDRATARRLVERIIASVNEPFEFEGRALRLGASIGLAICPDDGNRADTLLELADQAMYSTKRLKSPTPR
jgi:diguanylate cyclase (GGDEF)-like protein